MDCREREQIAQLLQVVTVSDGQAHDWENLELKSPKHFWGAVMQLHA